MLYIKYSTAIIKFNYKLQALTNQDICRD